MKLSFLVAGLGLAGAVFTSVAVFVPAGTGETTKVFRTERLLSKSQLRREADLVIVGRLTTSRTYTDRTTGEAVSLTEWGIDVERTTKGKADGRVTMTVIGGPNTVNTDLPALQSGQRVAAYLQAVPGKATYVPISLRQGLLREQGRAFRDTDGNTVAVEAL